MGAYGGRFYHGSIVEAHPFGQLGYAVIVYDEEVLGCAVSLECLYTQMFADIILSAFTGVALAADQLWAGGDVVTGAAYGYLAAYSHYHSRVLMSLYHWIECGGVETVVRVNLTAADADALDVDEHLMGCQVSCLGFCYFLKLDTLGFYQYCLSHSCIVFLWLLSLMLVCWAILVCLVPPIGLMTDGVLFLFVFQFCHDLVVLFLVESV